MLGDGIDISIAKYILGGVMGLLAFSFIFIFKMITGSYTLGCLIFLTTIWFLIFKIGITIMYPGSSSYFTSDIEMRIGSELGKNLHHLGHCLEYLASNIIEKKVDFRMAQWNLKEKILGNFYSCIEMLSMFEHSLSDRKSKMLEIIRQMQDQVGYKLSAPNYQSQSQINSVESYIDHPRSITTCTQEEYGFLCQRMENILRLNNELQEIIHSFNPPEGLVKYFRYKFFSEKLYEVRFGFQRWNHIFQYEVHMIQNFGYVIQSAIIKRNRTDAQNVQLNGKFVLFCNPNGVYIQFFAVENCYIKEYLLQGYQVILWNYRGYGQSTGSPSITKSQTDAMKIYNYYTEKGIKIEVVHGYSIGGCAATGLLHKLEKKQKKILKENHSVGQFRNERFSNNIKLLIVDRSFSSIGDMAIQFGEFLYKLARIVFTFQNKNLSRQFYELKVQKLLLWDEKDQVIPDTASVKSGVLMSLLKNEDQESSCSKCSDLIGKKQEQAALNEEVSVLINQGSHLELNQASITESQFLNSFVKAFKTLLKYSCSLDKKPSSQLNANHEYDPSYVLQQECENKADIGQNQELNLSEQIVSRVLRVLSEVDGGGSYLINLNITPKKLLMMNQLSFQHRCKTYILGLTFYGSVHPFKMAFKRKQNIRKYTLEKVAILIKKLEQIEKQMQQESTLIDDELRDSVKKVLMVFTSVNEFIQNKFIEPQNEKLGKLIALDNGHNGSLSKVQLIQLMKYIKNICEHNQNQQNTTVREQQHLMSGEQETQNSLNQMKKEFQPQQQRITMGQKEMNENLNFQ